MAEQVRQLGIMREDDRNLHTDLSPAIMLLSMGFQSARPDYHKPTDFGVDCGEWELSELGSFFKRLIHSRSPFFHT